MGGKNFSIRNIFRKEILNKRPQAKFTSNKSRSSIQYFEQKSEIFQKIQFELINTTLQVDYRKHEIIKSVSKLLKTRFRHRILFHFQFIDNTNCIPHKESKISMGIQLIQRL